jgi:putative ABC transport system permease protein
MWLLAIKSMLADRGKLLTSLLGVVFSVVLINLQGGLLLGLIQKASLLVDYGQADIWVGHRHMNNVDIGTFIPERWVHRIRGIRGVERAEPYIVMFGQTSMPDGRFENVVIVGCESASLLGNAWVMAEGDPRAVRHPDGIFVDVYDAARLGDCRIGDVREINGQRARVVGMTKGIVSFTTNPYVFTTLDRARNKYGRGVGVPRDGCCYFLVKARPGTDIADLCARIRARMPELDAYDRRTYSWMCMEYWLTRTGIGISFGMAAFLGLLVGLAVVAQTLYASVAERIREFGTLKAMGADDRCVGRFLIAQALGTAAIGSALGLLGSLGIGRTLSSPRSPVILTGQVATLSVVMMVLVCLLAAWLPYWRIRRIDPASVLRS